MYHADLVPSGNITLWILTHTCYHSATGWSCTMCTCLCFLSAVHTVHKVSYTLRCKGCPVSACLCGSVYAHSWKWMCRYSKVRRITSMCGGSSKGKRDLYIEPLSSQRPPPVPLGRNVAMNRARHLAATSIKSHLRTLRNRRVFPVPLSRKLIYTCRLYPSICTIVATFSLSHSWTQIHSWMSYPTCVCSWDQNRIVRIMSFTHFCSHLSSLQKKTTQKLE